MTASNGEASARSARMRSALRTLVIAAVAVSCLGVIMIGRGQRQPGVGLIVIAVFDVVVVWSLHTMRRRKMTREEHAGGR
jgi:multisubunit Na+/H+ antiporter MnhB subunit